MDKESIIREYESRLSTRDSLSSIDKELKELEETEIVKRYLRLIHYLKENEYLIGKSDDEVLDDLLDKVTIDEDESYLCFGKDYYGSMNKAGRYHLANQSNKSFLKLPHEIKLARYRSLTSNKEVLIPVEETNEFEENNVVYFSHSNDRDEEYKALRRKILKDKDKTKKLERK